MDLDDITLRKISQTGKDKYYDSTSVRFLEVKCIQTESGMVGARDGGRVQWDRALVGTVRKFWTAWG
jgi:hypothetical protein